MTNSFKEFASNVADKAGNGALVTLIVKQNPAAHLYVDYDVKIAWKGGELVYYCNTHDLKRAHEVRNALAAEMRGLGLDARAQ
jgi:hypothetical protein